MMKEAFVEIDVDAVTIELKVRVRLQDGDISHKKVCKGMRKALHRASGEVLTQLFPPL